MGVTKKFHQKDEMSIFRERRHFLFVDELTSPHVILCVCVVLHIPDGMNVGQSNYQKVVTKDPNTNWMFRTKVDTPLTHARL